MCSIRSGQPISFLFSALLRSSPEVPFGLVGARSVYATNQLHPLVAPQVSHFSQVPFRTIVKFWHSEHMLPV